MTQTKREVMMHLSEVIKLISKKVKYESDTLKQQKKIQNLICELNAMVSVYVK
jgi:hypothetical protein